MGLLSDFLGVKTSKDRDEVLIKVNREKPGKLCDVSLTCLFHEANISANYFGRNIAVLHEDISYSWGVLWTPIFNEKLVDSFSSLSIQFNDIAGYIPDARETLVRVCTEGLKQELLDPEAREGLQGVLIRNGGYMAKRNRGFIHYMCFDDLFQTFQDIFGKQGVRF